MTNDDELLARLMEEMKALPRVAMVVTPEASPDDALALSPEAVWAILASLQLALRHPGLQDGPTPQKVRTFLEWIHHVFIPPGSAMEEVFQRGFEEPR